MCREDYIPLGVAKSQFHSLARILAKRRHKLVLMPVHDSCCASSLRWTSISHVNDPKDWTDSVKQGSVLGMSRVTNVILTAHVGARGDTDREIASVNDFLREAESGGGGKFVEVFCWFVI
jgi:hypothetical protein